MNINDGGSAFPFHHKYDGGDAREDVGMSLRDYFAGQALPEAIQHERELRRGQIAPGAFRYDGIAEAAYAMADAMLKAREAK